jgi:hypothetical protein
LYAVPSKSELGVWHFVTLDWCSCKAYEFRARCSHLEAVKRFVAQARGSTRQAQDHVADAAGACGAEADARDAGVQEHPAA